MAEWLFGSREPPLRLTSDPGSLFNFLTADPGSWQERGNRSDGDWKSRQPSVQTLTGRFLQYVTRRIIPAPSLSP